MNSHGLNVEDRWRNCLGDDDPNCQFPEAPVTPGELIELKEPQHEDRATEQHRGSQSQSQGQSRAAPGTGASELPETSAIDEEELNLVRAPSTVLNGKVTRLSVFQMSENGDEGDEEAYTTDDC